MFDQVFWRATSGQINRWRRDYLGIGPTNLDKMMQHKVPFLYNFSPTVVPAPLDWVEWIRVTGSSAYRFLVYLIMTLFKATGSWRTPKSVRKSGIPRRTLLRSSTQHMRLVIKLFILDSAA